MSISIHWDMKSKVFSSIRFKATRNVLAEKANAFQCLFFAEIHFKIQEFAVFKRTVVKLPDFNDIFFKW